MLADEVASLPGSDGDSWGRGSAQQGSSASCQAQFLHLYRLTYTAQP